MMGPKDLVLSLFAYSQFPFFPRQGLSPIQADNQTTTVAALYEAAQAAGYSRIICTFRGQLPPSSSLYIRPGSKLRVDLDNFRSWEVPVTATKSVRKSTRILRRQKVKSFACPAVFPQKHTRATLITRGYCIVCHIMATREAISSTWW